MPRPPHASLLALLVLAVLGASLAGCGGTRRHVLRLDVPADVERLAVDVDNFRGHVEVIADAGARDATVQCDVWLDWINEDRRAGYDSVRVDARVRQDQPGVGVLEVTTRCDVPEPVDRHARLVVRVPRLDGVRVVNRDGVVEIVDAAGAAEIRNRGGAVEYRTSHAIRDDVTILNVDGDVYFQVPEGSRGFVDLATLDGLLAYKDAFGTSEEVHDTGQALTARLGRANNDVVVRTNDGDIRMLIMEDPLALTRAFKGSFPEVGDHLYLDGTRRFTRNLPDDTPRER